MVSIIYPYIWISQLLICDFFLGFWRWQHKYMQPKKVGIAPFVQVTVGAMIFFYALNYGKMSK